MVELLTAQNVRDALATIPGLTLPASLTDGLILEIVTKKSANVLNAFSATALADLPALHQDTAKDACLQYCVAELLLRFWPAREDVARTAAEYRRAATESVDRAISGKSAASPAPRRIGSKVI